jgi:hypothetical protein
MQRSSILRNVFLMIAVGALFVGVHAQDAPKAAPTSESKGLPPRAGPAEYAAQAPAGAVTVAAEFMGHSVPTADGTYSTEDYVAVEVALFGAAQASAKLSRGDFSLRVNGKKAASPSQPYELVFHSLKDPEWEPPVKAEKSKSSFGTGGGGNEPPPTPPKMPLDLRRAMEQRVQRAAMLEGGRVLPQAGLLFFEFRGKTQSIKSLELIYSGPAGNATLALQP